MPPDGLRCARREGLSAGGRRLGALRLLRTGGYFLTDGEEGNFRADAVSLADLPIWRPVPPKRRHRQPRKIARAYGNGARLYPQRKFRQRVEAGGIGRVQQV